MSEMLSYRLARERFPDAFELAMQRCIDIAQQTGITYVPMAAFADGSVLNVILSLETPRAGLSDMGSIQVPLGSIN